MNKFLQMSNKEGKDKYNNYNVFEAAITANNIVNRTKMGTKTDTRNSKKGNTERDNNCRTKITII